MSLVSYKEKLKTVLVIEDSYTQRVYTEKLLESQDFMVRTAEDAATGATALEEHEVDLVILDLELPDKDGLVLCGEIMACYDIPVIIVSGRDEPHDRVIGLGVGAEDYVVKPYEPLELLLRIETALNRLAYLDGDETKRVSIPGSYHPHCRCRRDR